MAKVTPTEAEQRLTELIREANGTLKALQKMKDTIERELLSKRVEELIDRVVLSALDPKLAAYTGEVLEFVTLTKEAIVEDLEASIKKHSLRLMRALNRSDNPGEVIETLLFLKGVGRQ